MGKMKFVHKYHGAPPKVALPSAMTGLASG